MFSMSLIVRILSRSRFIVYTSYTPKRLTCQGKSGLFSRNIVHIRKSLEICRIYMLQGFTINDTDGDSNGGKELETENCDLNHGNPGGPCFAWWNNGTDPRIVGVVSSQEVEDRSTRDNVFASGDGFANLCAWGRTNWPA